MSGPLKTARLIVPDALPKWGQTLPAIVSFAMTIQLQFLTFGRAARRRVQLSLSNACNRGQSKAIPGSVLRPGAMSL